MDELQPINSTVSPVFARSPTKCFLCCYIRLTEGKVAAVNPWDWVSIDRKGWRAKLSRGGWYAYKRIIKHGKVFHTYLHRLVANTPKGMECHHKNGDGLDDRGANLENLTVHDHEQLSRMLKIARKKRLK